VTAVSAWVVLAAVVGGMGGVMLDSLIGATVQSLFWCPRCQKETERNLHSCGTSTQPWRGWRWVDNDVVNFLSTLGSLALGALLGLGFGR